MQWFGFLTKRRNAKTIANLAAEIAGRSQPAVWERVERRVPAMRLAEARGYVRARSAAVIHHEVERILGSSSADPNFRGQLARQATEIVVSLVFRELLAMPVRYQQSNRRAA